MILVSYETVWYEIKMISKLEGLKSNYLTQKVTLTFLTKFGHFAGTKVNEVNLRSILCSKSASFSVLILPTPYFKQILNENVQKL
jgi:hypothetical protein